MAATESRCSELHLLEQWIDGTSLESRLSENEGWDVTASGFGWHIYQTCLKLLKKIIQTTQNTGGPTGIESRPLKDCLSRLFLWGEGFGGGQLDKIIQRSDALKSTILQFIAAISKILLDNVLPQIGSTSLHREVSDLIKELRPLVEKVESITADEIGGSDEDYDDSESVISTPGVQRTAAEDIDSYVSCLMRLLPTMEHTLMASEEQYNRNIPPLEFHVSNAALTYVHHVRDKYKNADAKLVSRLGEANLQRHAAIRRKMAQEKSIQEEQVIAEEVEQVPKSMFMPTSIFHDSGLGSMPTAWNMAPTVASHSSFETDGSQSGKSSFRVPEPPAGAYDGAPFPCFVCGHVLKNIKNRYDWKVHVFADLQPYICTFSECADSLRTFPTRKLWQDHEFSQHRSGMFWTCPCCKGELSSPDEWKNHMETNHKNSLTDVEARYAFAASKRTRAELIDQQKCPLCLKIPGKSQRAFATHVCKHLESIALAALPTEASSDAEVESVSGHSSIHSDPVPSSDLEAVKTDNRESQYGGYIPHNCPSPTCRFHAFEDLDSRTRHIQTHYKAKIYCGFCPSSLKNVAQRTSSRFSDVSALKNHLIAHHGVSRNKARLRKGNPTEAGPGIIGECSMCSGRFPNARDYYDHIDDCLFQKIAAQSPSDDTTESPLVEIEHDSASQVLRPNKGLATKGQSVDESIEDALDNRLMGHFTREGKKLNSYRCRVSNCVKLFKTKLLWRRHVQKYHSDWLDTLGGFFEQSFGPESAQESTKFDHNELESTNFRDCILLVSGIHPKLGRGAVIRFFSKYGEVEDFKISHVSGTVSNEDYHVQMATPEEAKAAAEGLNGIVVEGQTWEIRQAPWPPVSPSLPPLVSDNSSFDSIILRGLSLDTSMDTLKSMVSWCQDCVGARLLPRTEDGEFCSAIIQFRSAREAIEARNRLDGKPNLANNGKMSVGLRDEASKTIVTAVIDE